MTKTTTCLLLMVLLWSAPSLVAAELVDLNSASLTQLMSLPGIGPALAERIIQYRKENGRFNRIEDLLNVRGIGAKKFAQLEKLIVVSAPADAPAPRKSKPKPW